MSVTLYRVSAFPYEGTGGNEAGVVIETDHLTDKEMLTIAQRVNYSETAFLLPSDKADFKLRYFTPATEVKLCGHATIATFNLLRNMEIVELKPYTIETKEGILNVIIEPEHVSLQLTRPIFGKELNKKHIAEALDLNPAILSKYPIQTVSTGATEIFVGIKTLQDLHDVELDESKIIELCQAENAHGLYLFTLETKHNSDAHGRNFLPVLGIYEESATGTASGGLASFLHKHVTPEKTEYVFEQGYTLFKPSQIQVTLDIKNDEVDDLYVGGKMRFIDKIIGFMPNEL